MVAFTGKLASMRRAEAFALVIKHGGTPVNGVTRKTAVLIVGQLGWPLLADGRVSNSLTKARSYGVPIKSERAFLASIGRSLPDRQTKAYTKAQLAALAQVPGELVDHLAMFGLLAPGDGLYGFRDLAAARQIASLMASGVKLSTIAQSLAEIQKWLPDAGLANLRLFPEPAGALLVEQAGGRTNKKGQFVLPITPAECDPDLLFQRAQAAEDFQDWDTADRLYRLVMKIDPGDSVAPFNLANVLRSQNKLVESEAAYRIALERKPDFAEAWFNLADLLEEQRLSREALLCLELAIEADPDYADAVFNLALLLQRLERLDDAAKQWRRYLEIDQASSWAARAKKALKLCEMQMAFS